MATNNKKKKQTKSKRTTGKKRMPMNKPTKRRGSSKKKLAKKPAPKKAAAKTKSVGKKTIGRNAVRAHRKQVGEKGQGVVAALFSPRGRRSHSAGQSGDLQGLSGVGAADSESVKELLEEGNAFEADVVTGVEDAGNAEGMEVHTHEVPEDDVPGEYLDEE